MSEHNETREISVNGLSKFGTIALVSAADFEKVNRHSWNWNSDGYAMTMVNSNGKNKLISMSRFILEGEDNLYIDHMNGIKYDNQRENLRLLEPTYKARNQVV
jgi:hypothetical protein